MWSSAVGHRSRKITVAPCAIVLDESGPSLPILRKSRHERHDVSIHRIQQSKPRRKSGLVRFLQKANFELTALYRSSKYTIQNRNLPMEQRSSRVAMKVTSIAVAITLITGFVIHRQRSGNVLRSIHTTMLPVDTSETRNGDTAGELTEWMEQKGLVLDLYGNGGMITLDSLKRRVDLQRVMLSSSKSLMVANGDEAEWNYLDSLLKAASERK